MAGSVSGLHVFAADTGPEALSLLDTNYGLLTTAFNTLSAFSNSYIDSGAVNAMVVTVPAPQVFSYTDGVILQVKVAATSTSTAPTINVNGLGAKTITNPDGSVLVAGQLAIGGWATLQYEAGAGKFQLLNNGGAGNFTNGLTVTAAGRNVASLQQLTQTFGNTTDNPTYTFQGTGATLFGGTVGSTINTNSDIQNNFKNTSAGTSAACRVQVFNGTNRAMFAVTSTAYSGTFIPGGPSGEITALDTIAGPVVIGTGDTARLVISATGSFIQGYSPTLAALTDMTPDTGSFTGTLVGGTTSPTVTVKFFRIGKLVIMLITNVNFTSNSASFSMSGVPASLQPSTSIGAIAAIGPMRDNGVEVVNCFAGINNTGSVIFYKGSAVAANWTNSGLKGIGSPVGAPGIFFVYSLD